MRARLIVQLDSYRHEGTTFASNVGCELVKYLRRHAGGGAHCSSGRLTKLRVQSPDDGDKAVCRTEVPEEELATRSLGERELRAGVNRAEMVEVARVRWQAEQLGCVGCALNADERVEREFCDAEPAHDAENPQRDTKLERTGKP